MKKWFLLLAFALLFNTVYARAEGDVYYTSNEDRYYHLDADCDRPERARIVDAGVRSFHDRKAYTKYVISEEAALAFEKTACPVCVKKFEPVYLGKHMPEWNHELAPWDTGLDVQERERLRSQAPQAYRDEVNATGSAFGEYYQEVYNRETQGYDRLHEYPAHYTSHYLNNSYSRTFLVVDPSEEILSAFERMFGGGAWIVASKYGHDEIYENRERVFQALMEWCESHPEVDARPSSAGGPSFDGCAVIGIDGSQWQQAAAALDEIASVYIHFAYEQQATTDWSFK